MTTFTRPVQTPSPDLFTYRDAIDHLRAFVGGLSQEADQERARSAIQESYREVGQTRKWKYHQTLGSVPLDASYSTGTVTYVSSTRALTLATGSWPSWTKYGKVAITGYDPLYKVQSVSGAIATLDANFCPTANISTATAYTLIRTLYPLPGDLLHMEDIMDESYFWSRGYAVPDEIMRLEREFKTINQPFRWTIAAHPDLHGLALWIYGYPSAAESLHFMYQRRPRPLMLDGYALYSSQGTGVYASVATTTATLTGLTTQDDMVGAVFRLGRTSGTYTVPGGRAAYTNYATQRIVTAVPSSSTLTLDSAPDSTLSGNRGFAISDPVDLPEYLWPAFLRGCEYHMLMKVDASRAKLAYDFYREALRLALASDSIAAHRTFQNGWRPAMWETAVWTDPS